MDVGTTTTRDELRAYLDTHRRKVIERIVRAVAESGGRTLKLDLLASCFLDRLLRAIESDSSAAFATWLALSEATTPDADRLRDMISGGTAAVISFVESSGRFNPPTIEWIVRLRARITSEIGSFSNIGSASSIEASTALDRAIANVMCVLDESDRFTSDHSRAVASWCARLAQKLGIGDEQTEFVTVCGMLHDIGKTVTPHAILYKPGRLNDEEWGIIKLHPAMGARILDHITELRHCAEIVRAHHERFDGLGYPDRLVGEQIPLTARIVSVADAFHAMVSDRPYRKAIAPNAALGELVRWRGKQFDPDAVDAMLKIFGVTAGDVRSASSDTDSRRST
jgi:putative nucleotidyltransferase with HDIG domain